MSEAAQLLTPEDLAERWRVKKNHVYRLSREGKIPVVKLGKYYRYRLDQIEAYEATGAILTGPQQNGSAMR